MNDPGSIYGRGVGFPFRVDDLGRVAWSEGALNVRESIRILLLTGPKERLMLPELGAGLERYLFEPNVTATQRAVSDAIADTLRRWEPRISVDNVRVAPDVDDPSALLATIEYRLVATQTAERVSLRVDLAR